MFVSTVMWRTHISVLWNLLLCTFYSMKTFSSILVQLEIPVQSDQSFSEEASPANTSHSTARSADASLQEGKVEDTESSSVTVRTQEPSAATGSYFDFIFHIDAFLKAVDARCFVLVRVPLTNIVCFCNINHREKCIFLFLMDSILILCFGE